VDEDDSDHDASLELLESHPGPLLVPQLVIAEVAYLIETRLGWIAETRFLGAISPPETSLRHRSSQAIG
jgi:predicted nucleic acid-binding protein